jgi:hypothetical protein
MPEKKLVRPMLLQLVPDRRHVHLMTTIAGELYGCRLEPNEARKIAWALETLATYIEQLNRAGAAEQTDAGKPERVNISGNISLN